MTRRYNPRSILTSLSESLTLVTMLGLPLASAAALAGPLMADAEPVRLPTVVVTAKSAAAAPEAIRLPLVVVTAKRSS